MHSLILERPIFYYCLSLNFWTKIQNSPRLPERENVCAYGAIHVFVDTPGHFETKTGGSHYLILFVKFVIANC